MKILTWSNNIVLRKISEDILSQKEARLIEKKVRTTLLNNNDVWVWLAAPQIWLNKRVFIAMLDKKKIMTFVNPKILKFSVGTDIAQEWCLSLPWVWWDVERSKSVQVEFLNTKMEKIILNLDWFWAKVFQHELDHLNWVLFIDKLVDGFYVDDWVDLKALGIDYE